MRENSFFFIQTPGPNDKLNDADRFLEKSVELLESKCNAYFPFWDMSTKFLYTGWSERKVGWRLSKRKANLDSKYFVISQWNFQFWFTVPTAAAAATTPASHITATAKVE